MHVGRSKLDPEERLGQVNVATMQRGKKKSSPGITKHVSKGPGVRREETPNTFRRAEQFTLVSAVVG